MQTLNFFVHMLGKRLVSGLCKQKCPPLAPGPSPTHTLCLFIFLKLGLENPNNIRPDWMVLKANSHGFLRGLYEEEVYFLALPFLSFKTPSEIYKDFSPFLPLT